MDEKKQEAIVLLNDGEKNENEGHCNSWPYVYEYSTVWIEEYCSI